MYIIYNSITLTTDKMQSKIVHLDYKGLVIYDAFGVITEHDTFDILTLKDTFDKDAYVLKVIENPIILLFKSIKCTCLRKNFPQTMKKLIIFDLVI